MHFKTTALISIGLLHFSSASSASNGALTDALHSITNKCISRDTHNACNEFAAEQMAACSPDDLNCQCSKVATIREYCRDVCDNNDYITDATRNFLENTCKASPVVKREANNKEERKQSSEKKKLKNSDILEGLALKQLLDSNQIPHGFSNVIEDSLRPAVSKLREELGSQDAQSPAIEKRYTSNRHGVGRNLQLRLLDTRTGQLISVPDSYVYQHVPEFDDEELYYYGDGYRSTSDYKSSMENPPSRYRDWDASRYTPPNDNKDDDYPNKVDINYEQRRPGQAVITMYRDVPVQEHASTGVEDTETKTTSASPTGVENGVFGRIRQKLNINAVHRNSTESGTLASKPTGTRNGTTTTPKKGSNTKVKTLPVASSSLNKNGYPNFAAELSPSQFGVLVALTLTMLLLL